MRTPNDRCIASDTDIHVAHRRDRIQIVVHVGEPTAMDFLARQGRDAHGDVLHRLGAAIGGDHHLFELILLTGVVLVRGGRRLSILPRPARALRLRWGARGLRITTDACRYDGEPVSPS